MPLIAARNTIAIVTISPNGEFSVVTLIVFCPLTSMLCLLVDSLFPMMIRCLARRYGG